MNRCIVCDDEIKFNKLATVISDAVICETNGNYGSTVLDLAVWPDGQRDKWLEFYICDKCMILKKEYFTMVKLREKHYNTYDRSPWDPNSDEV